MTTKADRKDFKRVECRFRRHDEEHWSSGKIIEGWLNKDGSLNIVDGKTGAIRSMYADCVQVTEKGPRGGKKWVDYDPQ